MEEMKKNDKVSSSKYKNYEEILRKIKELVEKKYELLVDDLPFYKEKSTVANGKQIDETNNEKIINLKKEYSDVIDLAGIIGKTEIKDIFETLRTIGRNTIRSLVTAIEQFKFSSGVNEISKSFNEIGETIKTGFCNFKKKFDELKL